MGGTSSTPGGTGGMMAIPDGGPNFGDAGFTIPGQGDGGFTIPGQGDGGFTFPGRD